MMPRVVVDNTIEMTEEKVSDVLSVPVYFMILNPCLVPTDAALILIVPSLNPDASVYVE